ncbi:lysozyme inhibitor LprI family protein [Serratia rhizosphaerae]|uniref:lysozyme inhibitor LprI family protein n=1 Tax=Serratia rhizosphaerae TaxID=2597702 RepID=UPI002DBB1AA6|nr:lysozyme inhibitor LprI family protein [Serratia rhizosphaerae]MEB6336558.1 lysozyme inhibitor LprI family protein [Serratia rhizosphaerae]
MISPRTRKIKRALSLSLICCLIPYATYAADKNAREAIVSSIEGQWQVNQVNIYNDATRTLSYQFNDPRLIGRVITISNNKIQTNFPEGSNCLTPKLAEKTISLDQYITDTMGGEHTITAKSYELNEDGNKHVLAQKITCASGSFGPADNAMNARIAVLNANKLLVNWYDGSLLQLNRLPANPKPVASFECSNAKSNVEKAICSDFNLAAYDKSVARAWLLAKKQSKNIGDKNLSTSLMKSQKSWLQQRDKCMNDKKCLTDAMSTRINSLSSYW